MGVERFVVLDVEGMSGSRPYNVGYIVADRYGKIYKKRSIAIPSAIWENIASALKIGQAIEMTKSNVQEILQDMDRPRWRRKYRAMTVEGFTLQFYNDIKKHHVSRVFAYNVSFDNRAIFYLIGIDAFAEMSVDWCDIISGILTAKLLTKNYVNWCFTNGFTTETGIASYKAEVVYRYLTGQLNFEEEHTGLADVLIEYEILLAAFKTHKALDFSPCCAWRRLKKFAEENGLVNEGRD